MSSVRLAPAAAGRAAPSRRRDGAATGGKLLLLGERPLYPPAWWLDPINAILFLVLPIFLFAAYLNRFNYWVFNASEDFVTPETFRLGLYSMGLLISGTVIARLAKPRRDMVSALDAERAAVVLTRLGLFTVAAYLLLLGSLVPQYDLVIGFVRGNASAATDVRAALGRIPGITSFVQLDVIYLALASALVTMTRFRMTSRLWLLTGAVFGFTFLRSVLASERLALLEALAAIAVIPVAYRWRPSLWRSLAPFLGILFVFLAFAAGEYFRSWQYYQYYYDSYLDFITQRFAGYFSTSINNGSGTYLLTADTRVIPQITSGWVTKFPILGQYLTGNQPTVLDRYLETYATLEFNNPGGFYAAFLDYPFAIANLFMVGIGIVIGLAHRGFENKSLLGLVLYPAVFLGLTDIIRILYVSDTRTLPIFLGGFVTVWALRVRRVPLAVFQAERARLGEVDRA